MHLCIDDSIVMYNMYHEAIYVGEIKESFTRFPNFTYRKIKGVSESTECSTISLTQQIAQI